MSKGETNQSEIARILQVDRSIVCRDIAYLRQQATENIAKKMKDFQKSMRNVLSD
jgi:NADH/NAD ratio-sensing transcriptional regulator Rex